MYGAKFKLSAMEMVGAKMLRKLGPRSLDLARCYAGQAQREAKKEGMTRERHPYKNIHPWRSLGEFTKQLVDNVIYNEGGLVALNKPYGISSRPHKKREANWKLVTSVANGVDYTVTDAIPDIAKELGHRSLTIVKTPERYISGVTLLAADEKTSDAVRKSLSRALPAKKFSKTHWLVTSRIPKLEDGRKELAITMKKSPDRTFGQPVILTTWKKNAAKRLEVRTLNAEHRLLSRSPDCECCLLEIKASTTKFHALRVFASTVLYSPILGDSIHGSRVQEVMGTLLKISPFSDAARRPPRLSAEFLGRLDLVPGQEVVIPAHIHLRQMRLMGFMPEKRDLILEAPLPPAMVWTCRKLRLDAAFESSEDRAKGDFEDSQLSD